MYHKSIQVLVLNEWEEVKHVKHTGIENKAEMTDAKFLFNTPV